MIFPERPRPISFYEWGGPLAAAPASRRRVEEGKKNRAIKSLLEIYDEVCFVAAYFAGPRLFLFLLNFS